MNKGLSNSIKKVLTRLPKLSPTFKVNLLTFNLDKVEVVGEKPFMAIHVALYNERRVVERLIKACISQEYFKDSNEANYEVVIADDSTDETTSILKSILNSDGRQLKKVEENEESEVFESTPSAAGPHASEPRVTLVHRFSRSGFKGAALHKALELTDAKVEYIAIFDADFVPYPDTLMQFAKAFYCIKKSINQKESDTNLSESDNINELNDYDRIAAVQGYQWHVLNKSQTWVTRGVRTEYSGSYVMERAGEEIYGGLKQISGSVYCIRADVLRKFGWGKSITEDFELTLRLYMAGYKVAFTPYIQAPAEAVSTVKRLIRQRMRWAEGSSYNIKVMLPQIIRSPYMTKSEKFEFVYFAPYYLQAAFFVVGTLAWFISEAMFGSRLPFWTAALGWSLVFTNILALPLMNIVGLFLEESEERDYVGILSFVALSYIVVPFQAYAAIKGFIEPTEGTWFRTPKTGAVTDSFGRSTFGKFFGGVLGRKGQTISTLGFQMPEIPIHTPALNMVSSFNPLQANNFRIKKKRIRWMGRGALAFMIIAALLLNVTSFVFQKDDSQKIPQNQVVSKKEQDFKVEAKSSFLTKEVPEFSFKRPEQRKTSWFNKLTIGEVHAAESDVTTTLNDAAGNKVTNVEVKVTQKESEFKVALLPKETAKPGKYTLIIEWKDETGKIHQSKQDFTWGVLAINTNKSMYTPNETAKLGFGVLDDKGHTICAATLWLEVTTPSQNKVNLSSKTGEIKPSGLCSRNSVTNVADYLSEFKTSELGVYKLHLKAETYNGVREIDDKFEVLEIIPFDIERDSFPTRIYFPEDYNVSFTVTPRKDFKGKIQETVPANFIISNISDAGGAEVKDKKQVVGWEVDWKKDNSYILGYTIRFPSSSPDFYLIGPLQLSTSLDKDKVIFQEARQWQIASDDAGGRVWSTGMELQSTTAGMEWDTTTGSPTIDTTTKRSGSASLRSNPSATTAFIVQQFRANSTAIIYIRVYVRVATAPSALTTIIGYTNAAGTYGASIRMATDRTLEVWQGDTTAKIGSSSTALSLNTWYRVELQYDDSIANNTTTGYLDGTNFASGNGADLVGGGAIRIGVQTSTTADIYFDDVAVNTTTLPGQGRIVHMHPNAVGDNAMGVFGGANSGTAWGQVKDVTPNDATDYWTLVINADILDVNIEDSTTVGIGSTDTITTTQVGLRNRAVSAATDSQRVRIKSQAAGTVTSGPITARSTTTWRTNGGEAAPFVYQLTSDTNPQAAGSWTPALLDTAQIGSTAPDAAPDMDITALWLLVDYIAASDVPEVALGLAPLALAAPKIIKSIRQGTLVEDFVNFFRKFFRIIRNTLGNAFGIDTGKRKKVKTRFKKRQRWRFI